VAIAVALAGIVFTQELHRHPSIQVAFLRADGGYEVHLRNSGDGTASDLVARHAVYSTNLSNSDVIGGIVIEESRIQGPEPEPLLPVAPTLGPADLRPNELTLAPVQHVYPLSPSPPMVTIVIGRTTWKRRADPRDYSCRTVDALVGQRLVPESRFQSDALRALEILRQKLRSTGGLPDLLWLEDSRCERLAILDP